MDNVPNTYSCKNFKNKMCCHGAEVNYHSKYVFVMIINLNSYFGVLDDSLRGFSGSYKPPTPLHLQLSSVFRCAAIFRRTKSKKNVLWCKNKLSFKICVRYENQQKYWNLFRKSM